MGVYALLRDKFPLLKMEGEVSLARRTTIGCGGTVACSLSPSDAEETAETLAFCRREGIPHAVLGAGANTLPPDGDIEGALFRTDMMRGLILDGDTLYAGAGVTGGALLRSALMHGIGGFEPFAGIPMTVGGACVMNAGVRERHISDVVLRVLVVRNGRIESFPSSACRFGEKTSVFREGIFVVGALFRAEPAPQDRIRQRTADFLAKRAHLPKGRSMGCTFVNPEGMSAGEIVDRCGLKGLSVGGARVSEKHANFILNEGATSADISALIAKIREEVRRRTGILLREEIVRLVFRDT